MHLRRDRENASKASGSSVKVTIRARTKNHCGGGEAGCHLRTVSHISLKEEEAQSTPLHKGRMRQDFRPGHGKAFSNC